jgi:hypothetical protein
LVRTTRTVMVVERMAPTKAVTPISAGIAVTVLDCTP